MTDKMKAALGGGSLLVAGLLLPLLTHAAPFGGLFENAAAEYAALLALLFFTLLLMGWAYSQPAWRELQVVQAALLLVLVASFHLFQAQWIKALRYADAEWLAPWLSAVLPLGLLLNGLTQARQAHHDPARRVWTGVAVVGGASLGSGPLQQLLLAEVSRRYLPASSWLEALSLLLGLVVLLAAWLLVLRLQARYPAVRTALAPPWWRTPTVAAGVSVVHAWYGLGLLLLHMPQLQLTAQWLLQTSLVSAGLCWLTGVVALPLAGQPAAGPVEP